MSHSNDNSLSISHNNPEADDSSTVFDADTVIPDEVPSLSPLTTLTANATDYLYNNNETVSSSPHSSQEESPANTISELLRRINSTRHRLSVPSTTTTAAATDTVYDADTVMPDQQESPATVARIEEISINHQHQSSSSSFSKKRPIITNSTTYQSTKRPQPSSRLKGQPGQICTDDKSDKAMDEDYESDESVIYIITTDIYENLTKFEVKWISKFKELCEYKRSNGNVNVPRSNKELGKWVNTQRYKYKKFKANKKSSMTNERIVMLESVGFEWVCPKKGGSKQNESKWDKQFNELVDYKKKYGNTNASKSSEDYKRLGIWVSKQRYQYRMFQENKKSQITNMRIAKLNSIGFQWKTQPGPVPRP